MGDPSPNLPLEFFQIGKETGTIEIAILRAF